MKWDDRNDRDDEWNPEMDFKDSDSSNWPAEVLPKEWNPGAGDEESGTLALLPG